MRVIKSFCLIMRRYSSKIFKNIYKLIITYIINFKIGIKEGSTTLKRL